MVADVGSLGTAAPEPPETASEYAVNILAGGRLTASAPSVSLGANVTGSARKMPSKEPPDVLLTRKEASRELATIGIRRSPETLAKIYSTRTDGPPCVHIGRTPYYPRSELHRWVGRQMTAPRSSSREPRRPGCWPLPGRE